MRDAAVSLLRVPVHKACYDAGLLGRGRGREVHVVGGRHEQVMFVRAAGEQHMGGGASTWAGTACVRRAGAHGDKQAHTACVH